MSALERLKMLLDKTEEMKLIIARTKVDPSISPEVRAMQLRAMRATMHDMRVFTVAFAQDYISSLDDGNQVA